MAASLSCTPSAATVSTFVEIDNDTTAAAALAQKPNISGTATPAFPSTIAAGKDYSGVDVTSGVDDAGMVYHGDCEFHWSTISSTDPSTGVVPWTFSQTGSPSVKCKTVATLENYRNGTHAVQFMINM